MKKLMLLIIVWLAATIDAARAFLEELRPTAEAWAQTVEYIHVACAGILLLLGLLFRCVPPIDAAVATVVLLAAFCHPH